MNEEIQKIIEAEAEKRFPYNHKQSVEGVVIDDARTEGFVSGATAVIENPEQYGLITKLEFDVCDQAHDLTLQQLMEARNQREEWKEMCIKLAEEMRAAEWESPLYWEALGLIKKYQP